MKLEGCVGWCSLMCVLHTAEPAGQVGEPQPWVSVNTFGSLPVEGCYRRAASNAC